MATRRYRAYLTEKSGRTERICNALFQIRTFRIPEIPAMSSTGNKNEGKFTTLLSCPKEICFNSHVEISGRTGL